MVHDNLANISRAEKIMIVIHELSEGEKRSLKYEDIVVGVFRRFPADFHLRGYAEYPDSGDLIHKPLYSFRKKGYLEANNKVFSLTDRGIAYAQQLVALTQGKSLKSDGRLSRFAEKEISRIETSEAFLLFANNQEDRITDTDFYGYIAVTPRTSKNDFLGRLETVESAIKELGGQNELSSPRNLIAPYNEFMLQRFVDIIQHFKTVQ